MQRSERERASRVYRNWAVSILLCRRTSGSHRNEKNTFRKMLFHYRPLIFISFPSLVSVRVALIGLIKRSRDLELVRYRLFSAKDKTASWIHNWPPSINVSMSICLPSTPFFTLYKNISPFFTFLPELGDLHACQSDLLRKPSCLDGSTSHCLSVNVFF